jgi:hypothetical protein
MSEMSIEIGWYQALVYDCQQLIEEAKEQIVYKHWQMGRRILQEEFKFGKPEYGSHTIKNLANDLGISDQTIYNQLKLAKNYPEFPNAFGNLPLRHAIKMLSVKTNERNDKARKFPSLKSQYKAVDIRRGDFREVLADIPDQSVKLILTDPPYGKNYLSLWDDLGKFAARVLQQDGGLIAYSGQLYHPEMIAALVHYLDWWWLCAVVHAGSGNLTPLGQPVRKVINKFKPILVFVPKGGGLTNVFTDLVNGAGPSKTHHNWEQPVAEAYAILKTFCSPGDLVIDPFAGSGSVGVAAKELNLKFIGAEILPNGDD